MAGKCPSWYPDQYHLKSVRGLTLDTVTERFRGLRLMKRDAMLLRNSRTARPY